MSRKPHEALIEYRDVSEARSARDRLRGCKVSSGSSEGLRVSSSVHTRVLEPRRETWETAWSTLALAACLRSGKSFPVPVGRPQMELAAAWGGLLPEGWSQLLAAQIETADTKGAAVEDTIAVLENARNLAHVAASILPLSTICALAEIPVPSALESNSPSPGLLTFSQFASPVYAHVGDGDAHTIIHDRPSFPSMVSSSQENGNPTVDLSSLDEFSGISSQEFSGHPSTTKKVFSGGSSTTKKVFSGISSQDATQQHRHLPPPNTLTIPTSTIFPPASSSAFPSRPPLARSRHATAGSPASRAKSDLSVDPTSLTTPSSGPPPSSRRFPSDMASPPNAPLPRRFPSASTDAAPPLVSRMSSQLTIPDSEPPMPPQQNNEKPPQTQRSLSGTHAAPQTPPAPRRALSGETRTRK